MTLAKLTITPYSLTDGKLKASRLETVAVLFNPSSYTITKPVSWYPSVGFRSGKNATERHFNAPRLEFGGGGSRTLTLELFFDVTEPMDGVVIDDVRQETNKVVNLTRIERDTQQPPVCVVAWGEQTRIGSDFPFKGVVTNLTQNFTLFKRNGKPVRANLSVTFTEFLDPEEDKRRTDPELTTRLVKRGDTLSSIANNVYSDAKQWRVIAEANHIDDPRHLQIGTSLTIPKLN